LWQALGSVVTSEFYIFAKGTRFDGEALMAALRLNTPRVSATRRK
jgi:hypothetical protein